MRLAPLVGLVGIVMGFLVGYTFWALQVDELTSSLGKTRAELLQTQGWLGEEIRASDERHQQVSARLNRALADLARARARLGRIDGAAKANPGADASRRSPTGASPRGLAHSAF
jgi:hypothetical protein